MKSVIKKFYHLIKCLSILTVFFLLIPVSFILYHKKKWWLISEVDFDARDNGYVFFTYLKEKHPEINVAYLIPKTHPKYREIKMKKNAVEPHSLRHMLIFISARVRISTLVHGCSPSNYITKYVLYKHHFFGKNVALKHGIFKNLHPNYFKENAHLDLICCATKQEFDFIKNEFHYDEGVAQLTGLARFDNLNDAKIENQVLVMPTWRRWLDSISSADDFIDSEFYKQWILFLNNSDLKTTLAKNNTKIVFFLHPKLSKFVSCFKDNCPEILFLDKNSGSIQEELKKSKMLITDYSSVFFDFAYLKKPVVFYQFDENEYFKEHYLHGYFDYRKDGFGAVCTNFNEIINSTTQIVLNNYIVDKKYSTRADLSFLFRDSNNSDRIFKSINEMFNARHTKS